MPTQNTFGLWKFRRRPIKWFSALNFNDSKMLACRNFASKSFSRVPRTPARCSSTSAGATNAESEGTLTFIRENPKIVATVRFRVDFYGDMERLQLDLAGWYIFFLLHWSIISHPSHTRNRHFLLCIVCCWCHCLSSIP